MSQEAPQKDVFLAMPGYGQVTAGAARGFWRAVDYPNRVWFHYQEGSLLACNFNNHWCAALNLGLQGRAPKYFAMQHADIEPEDFWLDKLIEELEARDLDVLGVVAPIKDTKGLTSIALERKDGYEWRVECRLTMTECMSLPETFTSEDVGHKLLLNTGLWVCRFDPKWAERVHFEINDRIVIGADGKYFAECEPEDWNFSRQCHAQGLKIGCTRKVKLMHAGPMRWTNDRATGEPFDSAYLSKSHVLKTQEDFPKDVVGWLSEDEGAELAELADGKIVLEIGSYCGLSTICMARKANQVYAVDTFDGRGTPTEGDTRRTFLGNIERHGVAKKIRSFVGRSEEVVPRLPAVFDLVFIDGGHDYASVKQDIELAASVLKPGGLIAFHDYKANEPEVTVAVDEYLSDGASLVKFIGSLAVVRPPVAVLEAVNG